MALPLKNGMYLYNSQERNILSRISKLKKLHQENMEIKRSLEFLKKYMQELKSKVAQKKNEQK